MEIGGVGYHSAGSPEAESISHTGTNAGSWCHAKDGKRVYSMKLIAAVILHEEEQEADGLIGRVIIERGLLCVWQHVQIDHQGGLDGNESSDGCHAGRAMTVSLHSFITP